MKNILVIKENTLLSEVKKAINEGRKVIKLGNKVEQPSLEPEQQPMPQMETEPNIEQEMPLDGEEGAQYDTNFDAGVEADEDSDPKRYIQQLTGKLSQKLNSYNSEQADTGLCKYVASMIITATCKNLDDKVKKELADKVMSVKSNEEVEDIPTEEPTENDVPPTENIEEGRLFTKKELMEMVANTEDKVVAGNEQLKNIPKAWIGKK